MARQKTGGRVAGTPNKATQEARAVIAKVAEATAPKIQGWLNKVAAESPEKALDLFLKLLEYHVPKLARTELTGGNDEEGNKMPVLQVVIKRDP